ncbi:MAG: toxin-antitoxin system TumE family protein [Thiomonas sp.]
MQAKAELVTRIRNVLREGGLVEMVIWRLPQPVPPSTHAFKYRLAYVVDGERVVGFDNERGKGDHKHVGALECPYQFVDVDRLIDDFQIEVETWNNAH